MEENKSLTVRCQICLSEFNTTRKVRKVCSPCRGWILHIKGLYTEMHQIKVNPEIEVVTIDDDDDDDEGKYHQEPEVITLDD